MLTLVKMEGATRAADYYFNDPLYQYYSGRGETLGWWFGNGAAKLGLVEKADAEAFKNLLKGFTPDGSSRLVQNAGSEHRVPGWDLTFSAPKSVSQIYGILPSEMRPLVLKAHEDSVKETLVRVEMICGLSRRGQGGRTMEHVELVHGCHTHISSRANDANIHTHVATFNLGHRHTTDLSWGALYSRLFYDFKLDIGRFYRDRLEEHLTQDLGLKIIQEKVGFHIEGVPKSLCRENSKRRIAIEQEMQREGTHGAVAAKDAAVATRPEKSNISPAALHDMWLKAGERHGFGQAEALALIKLPKQEQRHESEHTKVAQVVRVVETESQQQVKALQHTNLSVQDDKSDSKLAVEKNSTDSKGDISQNPTVLTPVQAKQDDAGTKRQAEWSATSGPRKSHDRESARAKTKPHSTKTEKKQSQDPQSESVDEATTKANQKKKGWLRIEYKLLAPHAGEFSPLKHVKIPRIAIGGDKQFKRWNKIIWAKDLKVAQIRIQAKVLFPNAPAWSPASKLVIPAVRLLSPSQLKKAAELKKFHERKEERLSQSH